MGVFQERKIRLAMKGTPKMERSKPMQEMIDRLAEVEENYNDGIYSDRERIFHSLDALELYARALIPIARITL